MFSEKTFKSIFNNAVDGILVVDVEQKSIVLANKVFCEMSGYNEEEVKKLSFEDLHYEKDLMHIVNQFNTQAEGKLPIAKDLSFKKKDGGVFYVDINAIETFSANTKFLIAVLRDVSDRKNIVNELSFKTILLETQLETTIDGILVVDDKSNIVLYNQRFGEMWGIPKTLLDAKNDELVLQYGINLMKDPQEFKERVKELYNHKNQKSRDEIEFKDGRIFDRYSAPLISKDDQYLGRIWYFRDISEQRKAEERILRLSKAVEQSSEGIVLTNLDPRVQYANKAWAEMHGYTPEEAIGMKVSDLQTDEHVKIYEKAVNHMHSYDSWSGETSHKRKDGTTFPIQISVSMLRNEVGEPVGFISVSRDVTELKKAENALIKSEQKYRTLVENATVDIGSIDKDGKVIFMNSRAADRFGGRPEDYIGMKIGDLFPGEFADIFLKSILKVIETNQGINLELSPEIQGVPTVHETSIEPLRIPGEPVTSVMIISHEITDRKKAEDALLESEEKYRVLVENAGEAIVVINKEGVHQFANSTAAQRVGGSSEDIVGKTMWDLFPKEIADKQVTEIRHVIESGEGITVISQNIINNQTSWYEVTIQPFVANSQTMALVISRDITGRKKMEDALVESEERYRALVESAGETIAVINRYGEFLFMNKIAAKRLGGKPEDYIGKTMWDVFPKEIADRQVGSIRKVMDTGKGETFMTETITQGTKYWYETTIEPLRNNEDKIYADLIIGRDITKLKRAQEELEVYREEVAHAERLASLGTLSATAAHELTQPLTVIRLLIENAMTKLQNTSSPGTVIDKLRESLTEISNITSVVDRLRNFARKSTDKALKDVDLETIAKRIVNLLRESSFHPKVEMIIKDMDGLPSIYSNEKDLEQMFFALLDNAIQAAGDENDRKIIISGTDYDSYVELRFSDNCGGIAPENIERIFEPFFTTKPPNQGTGLGLCIVRDIVLRIGGKIRVESEQGKGSTFFVNIPLNN